MFNARVILSHPHLSSPDDVTETEMGCGSIAVKSLRGGGTFSEVGSEHIHGILIISYIHKLQHYSIRFMLRKLKSKGFLSYVPLLCFLTFDSVSCLFTVHLKMFWEFGKISTNAGEFIIVIDSIL